MSFEEWQATVPECIKRDKLWEFVAYQKALWLYDLAWDDCDQLMKDIRGRGNADQLNRSAGSICANIEEGYGRGFGKEYDYFTRVALGSARECRGWYFRRHCGSGNSDVRALTMLLAWFCCCSLLLAPCPLPRLKEPYFREIVASQLFPKKVAIFFDLTE